MRKLLLRLSLRHLLFGLLLLSGIIPLAISSLLLMRQNRELLKTQEKGYLTRSARFLSVELNSHMTRARTQLQQLGETVLAATPQAATTDAKLRAPWIEAHLKRFVASDPERLAVRLLDGAGVGPLASAQLDASVVAALDAAFDEAREVGRTVFRLVVLEEADTPVAVLAIPVTIDGSEATLFVQGVVRVESMETFFKQEAQSEVAVFLIDRTGQVLWSVGADEQTDLAVAASPPVRDFIEYPLNLTAEYTLELGGRSTEMQARVSPVEEPRWGVVIQKPVATAFGAARKMVVNTLVSTAVLIGLALLVAIFAARQIGRPLKRLTETSFEIAAGNFGKRVDTEVLGSEIGSLARNFNQMSGHVQQHVRQLQLAAQANQELFIGSMRAFVAAIDAKDPYTRGHSERVAAHSRTIAKHLGTSVEFQHQIWVGALLHDVGKIGIDDRILKKGGVLTAEEFGEMKLHPAIGAEIMSRIEQLNPMIPAIRWHHEGWNGKGYPDGRSGEQIPLMARIVAVADTFDAITTNRPYQKAYENDFAVETIRKLAGAKFDAKVVSAFLSAFNSGQIQVRRDSPPPLREERPAEAAASG